jgi:hypothetical protein
MPFELRERPTGGVTLDPLLAPRILIISPTDLADRLGKTILWRNDLERHFADTANEGFEKALALQPSLVLVHAGELPQALTLLKRIREDDHTRRLSLAAIAGRSRHLGEDALRRAGANLVLPASLQAAIYDRRLEELLAVPPRRETRLPASIQLWCRSEASGPLSEAVVLNISVRGMLIETGEPLPMGTTVEIRLPLPGEPEPVPIVALVERQGAAPGGRFRSGVQFLILRDHVRERIRAFIDEAAR